MNNILFYSNFCDGSKKLISMMNNENLLKYFKQECIDNKKSNITKTPTLIIVTPTGPVPYIGMDAFTWLSRVKQWKVNEVMKKTSQEQQQYLSKMSHNLSPNNELLLGFNSAEMTSSSDSFTLVDDTGLSIPQSYYQCNMQDNILFDESSMKKDTPLTDTQTINLRKKIMEDRKQQDKDISANIKSFRDQKL
jgi:hypothetical protein